VTATGPAPPLDDEGAGEPASVRVAADNDAAGLIALVGSCFSEYDGCVLDTEKEMAHLCHVATHFSAIGGRAWVAEVAGSVVGSVACRPASDDGGLELQMLYVMAPWRCRGLGSRFVALVESEAASRRATFVDLWTDTRFSDAHRLYGSLGYVQQPGSRELHDLSASSEYHFVKSLGR
jgi:putative acetyltransferase